ncbi:MAG: 2-hydroxyacid dehydrogenase [Lachnospiraceae bacterium]|jgi:D-lactate dehydrogenase|nr:2-hydroxyacid dehydrogenase [Lachnospiraceae bacterium]
MRIAFYGTKPYDRLWFEPLSKEYGYKIFFIENLLTEDTVELAKDCDAVCVFVNDQVTKSIIEKLHDMRVKAILLRSAGYNHVDIKAARGKIHVLRVPSYSPEAVAEFATAALLSVNRRLHRAYVRTREFNMKLDGLMGTDLNGKTAGVIGTGRIGQAMIRILRGMGMEILAYDLYPNPELGVKYVDLPELMAESDVITLHCPLTKETHHIINKETIGQMKKGVYLVNTSRGALVDSQALIEALKENEIFLGVALDVYEEEDGIFYEDCSEDIVQDDVLTRLMSFPNVLITSHQGYFTKEAMKAIALVTLENAKMLENGMELVNEVK